MNILDLKRKAQGFHLRENDGATSGGFWYDQQAASLNKLPPAVQQMVRSGQLTAAYDNNGNIQNLFTQSGDTQQIYDTSGNFMYSQAAPTGGGFLDKAVATAARVAPIAFMGAAGTGALGYGPFSGGVDPSVLTQGGPSLLSAGTDMAGGAELGASGMGGGTGLTLGGGASAAGMGGGTGLTAAGFGAGAGAGTGLLSTLGANAGWLGPALSAGGALINGSAAQGAASTQADAQLRAAQIAADAAKFRPVGITTGFGSSKFGYDANGNVTSAGYTLTPEMQAQRDALIASSGGLLGQFTGSQSATAPMGQAAQTAMQLGQGYLSTSPQAQAAKYLADQQGLLAPSRASTLADLQAQMQAQGRGGFAIGGGVNGMGAANPQLQAYYNAQLQQDAQLAANATQGGMDYAKFGAGMVGTGGDLLSSMYGVQTNAFNPYKTALGGAQTVEGLGQNALTQGMNMGSTVTAANASQGNLLGQGMTNAAATMAPANAYSPWGALLSGAGGSLQNYKWGT